MSASSGWVEFGVSPQLDRTHTSHSEATSQQGSQSFETVYSDSLHFIWYFPVDHFHSLVFSVARSLALCMKKKLVRWQTIYNWLHLHWLNFITWSDWQGWAKFTPGRFLCNTLHTNTNGSCSWDRLVRCSVTFALQQIPPVFLQLHILPILHWQRYLEDHCPFLYCVRSVVCFCTGSEPHLIDC